MKKKREIQMPESIYVQLRNKVMKKLIELLKRLFGLSNENEQEPAVTGETVESGETVDIEGTEIAGATEPVIVEPVEPEKKQYKIHILLDNGHAKSTAGKRSPKLEDGSQFFEYEFNRDIVRRLAARLDKLGVLYDIVTPEVDEDIPLRTRSQRVNNLCKKYGTDNCFFLSVHANAAGKGDRWMTARGFCCYTSKGETASDQYAEIFMREAEKELSKYGRTIRKWGQNKYSWEENFTVLVLTKCPAVLTENLFYDNKDEVKFLMSEEGREAVVQYHVNSILKIENLRP